VPTWHGGNSPLNQANNALATNTLGGQFLDPGNNPYLQKYLRAGLDQQNDSFNALTVPGIRSQFANSGRNLGGLDVDAVVRARNNLDRAQADATAGAEAGAYGDERGRQLQTQELLPSFPGMDLARAGALGNAGSMWDAYNQKLRDEAISATLTARPAISTIGAAWRRASAAPIPAGPRRAAAPARATARSCRPAIRPRASWAAPWARRASVSSSRSSCRSPTSA
jgi:hypothetical protein